MGAATEQPTSTARPVPSRDSSTTQSQQHHHLHHGSSAPWAPTYLRSAPLLGLSCLALVLLLTTAQVAVLIASNHTSASSWPSSVAPNVCLSLLNSLSNILLAVAIGYGVAIAWWRKAMKGATVTELHESWEASRSVKKNLMGSGLWRFDKVALAALAAKVAIADGVLFQRATGTYVAADPPKAVEAVGLAAREWPMTGYVVTEAGYGGQAGCGCFMIGDQYSGVVNTWEISNGFFRGYEDWVRVMGKSNNGQHCDGTCYTHVDAVGFEIDCQDRVVHEDIAKVPIAAWNAAHGVVNGTEAANLTLVEDTKSQWSNIPIFNSSFTLLYNSSEANYTYLQLDLLRFVSDDPYNPSAQTCAGSVYTTTCKLRPALVSYPVEVMNYSSIHVVNGVSLNAQRNDGIDAMMEATTSADADGQFKVTGNPPPPYDMANKQAEGYTVKSYIDVHDQHVLGGATALGGLASAIDHFLSSTAAITYDGRSDTGVPAWGLMQEGTLAQRMMYGPPNMGSCDCSFLPSSLDTLVQGINQLTFLTAVGMVNQDDFEGKDVSSGYSVPTWEVERNGSAQFHALSATVQVSDVVHYVTHFPYMAAGIASTILVVLLVLPSYWKYGELGREVTMGPIEVASAFQAPILTQGRRYGLKDTGKLEDLLKDVGERKVMYGFMDEHVPSATGMAVQRTSVYMGAPERVRPASGVYSPPTSPPTSPTVLRNRGILEETGEK